MNSQYFYSGSTQRFHGLSTDTKPTGCSNGSVFFEMDTGLVYLYDAENIEWNVIDDGISYEDMSNLPYINGVKIIGNKSLNDIGAAASDVVSKHNSALVHIVNTGCKNVVNWSANTQTFCGITFTNNGDGTWSTEGTASSRAAKRLPFNVPTTLGSDTYVLSGCPQGGIVSGVVKYALYLWDVTTSSRVTPNNNDTGSGFVFDWTPDASHDYEIVIDIRQGSVANGLKFKPMICAKELYDVSDEFVQYIPSNVELWRMILGLNQ